MTGAHHPLLTGDPPRLAPDFVAAYDLAGAALVLGVGSQVEQLADPSSDIDVLALFADAPPASVPDRAVVDMRTVLGTNWIGWFDTEWGRREINVECLRLDTLCTLAVQLVPPWGPGRAPLLQELEVRTLARLTTATVLAPPDAGDALARLRTALHLDRLPAFVALMNVVGAESYLQLATVRVDDPLGCHIALSNVIEGVLLSAFALDGQVLYDMKKAAAALRTAQRDGRDVVLTLDDVSTMLMSQRPADHLPRIRRAVATVRERIAARAAGDDPGWAEVSAALRPAGGERP